jgi:mRNA-degrading endonuclease toxin of MazEF toxin-antitoxin module
VLSDQLRGLDWQARNAEKIGHGADDVVADTLAKVKVLLTVR